MMIVMRRQSSLLSSVLSALIVLLVSERAQGQQQTCDETCTNAECVQSSFDECTVRCNNTGVSATVGTCLGATFAMGSTVTCVDGACNGAIFTDQTTVTCTGENSCQGATLWNSTVRCEKGTNCAGVHAYASVVECLEYGSCDGIFVTPCSCCGSGDDDDSSFYSTCTPGYDLERCNVNTLDFCATKYLGRTCLEWGNPACAGLTLPVSETEVMICTNGDCQNQVFSSSTTGTLCENRNAADTCRNTNFTQTLVDCNAGACVNALFTQSSVGCYMSVDVGGTNDDTVDAQEFSCHGATAHQSTITCGESRDDEFSTACAQMNFVSSAVVCPFGSCEDALLLRCTCCDGDVCDGSYTSTLLSSSCTTNPAAFCSQIYLDRTCKDWGNPACADVNVEAATVTPRPLTICERGECQDAVFTSAAVLCDNKDFASTTVTTCDAMQATQSTVACEVGACRSAQLSDSTVTCEHTRIASSCASATLTRSIVSCRDGSCNSATFIASAITCDDYVSCISASIDECTCCDGDGCGYSIFPSCLGNLTTFCSACAGQGNPLCDADGGGTVVAPTPSSVIVTAPIPTAVAAPIPSAVDAPIPTTVAAPIPTAVAVPIPTTVAAPIPTAVAVPIPTTVAAPIPSAVAAPIPTTVTAPIPTTVSAPEPAVAPSPISPVDSGGPAPSDVDTYYTTGGRPLEIPPLDEAGESLEIIVWPKHGSITLQDDKTIIYSPFEGFSGTDSFDVEVCDANQKCTTTTHTVMVESASSSDDSGFSGIYLLSLLALLPIAAVMWYYKREGRESSPKLDPPDPVTSVPSSLNPHGTFADQLNQHPQHSRQQIEGADLQSSSKSVSYLTEETRSQLSSANVADVLRREDVEPQKQSVTRSSDPPGAHGVQQAQALPPSAMAVLRGDLPDNKDQCRSVAKRRDFNSGEGTTVLASAVLVTENEQDIESIEA